MPAPSTDCNVPVANDTTATSRTYIRLNFNASSVAALTTMQQATRTVRVATCALFHDDLECSMEEFASELELVMAEPPKPSRASKYLQLSVHLVT